MGYPYFNLEPKCLILEVGYPTFFFAQIWMKFEPKMIADFLKRICFIFSIQNDKKMTSIGRFVPTFSK